MAIQVTGSFQHGFGYFPNPELRLIPHLMYRGKISMDVHLIVSGSQVGTIPMYPDPNELQYNPTPLNPYSDLIYSLETYVITSVSGSNPGCTFTRY